MTHTVLVVLFSILLLPGLAMVFVPFLPAFWYLLAVAALFGGIDGFTHLTAANLAVLGGIVAASIFIDWSAGLLGAKFGGAAWKSLLYGAVGVLVGLLFIPPFGAFAGLFIGVLIGELLRQNGQREAVRSAAGALLGSVAGSITNAALAVAFVIFFFVFATS